MATEMLSLTDLSDCCEPLGKEPISADNAQELAAKLKAIADPARLRLISLLAASETGEGCVCDLVEPLGLSQGTVSHHLKVLREAGLVEGEKRGTWVHYRVVPGALAGLGALIG